MSSGHGFADYLLFVNGKAVGVLEAKPAGYRLTNVELQADKYAVGLPAGLNPPPFVYLSTGVVAKTSVAAAVHAVLAGSNPSLTSPRW